jgi:hypothetical protein
MAEMMIPTRGELPHGWGSRRLSASGARLSQPGSRLCHEGQSRCEQAPTGGGSRAFCQDGCGA